MDQKRMKECVWCKEEVLPEDCDPVIADCHWECQLRMIIGSVAHIAQQCSCYVDGSTENDPPGMTMREAAKAAALLYMMKEGLIRNGSA
jgi:hypothetical protein